MPSREEVLANPWLRPLAPVLLQPAYWTWNRRKVSLAFAVGLFSGLMPGPTQMLAAALLALLFRVNLPVALVTTLYTNPLTYLPLYWLAFEYGRFLLDVNGAVTMALAPLPVLHGFDFGGWLLDFARWCRALGWPLLVGVPALGLTLGCIGYLSVRLAWRVYLVGKLRKRRRARATR